MNELPKICRRCKRDGVIPKYPNVEYIDGAFFTDSTNNDDRVAAGPRARSDISKKSLGYAAHARLHFRACLNFAKLVCKLLREPGEKVGSRETNITQRAFVLRKVRRWSRARMDLFSKVSDERENWPKFSSLKAQVRFPRGTLAKFLREGVAERGGITYSPIRRRILLRLQSGVRNNLRARRL